MQTQDKTQYANSTDLKVTSITPISKVLRDLHLICMGHHEMDFNICCFAIACIIYFVFKKHLSPISCYFYLFSVITLAVLAALNDFKEKGRI